MGLADTWDCDLCLFRMAVHLPSLSNKWLKANKKKKTVLNFKLSHSLSQKLLFLFSNEQNRKERKGIHIYHSILLIQLCILHNEARSDSFLFDQSFWFHVSRVRSVKICNIMSKKFVLLILRIIPSVFVQPELTICSFAIIYFGPDKFHVATVRTDFVGCQQCQNPKKLNFPN